jgi:plasmid stability protein
VSARIKKKKPMKKQSLPKGWTQKSLRELAAHHDRQTEDEQAAEIEAALSAKGETLMVVPTALVREIQALIARKSKA